MPDDEMTLKEAADLTAMTHDPTAFDPETGRWRKVEPVILSAEVVNQPVWLRVDQFVFSGDRTTDAEAEFMEEVDLAVQEVVNKHRPLLIDARGAGGIFDGEDALEGNYPQVRDFLMGTRNLLD